MERRRPQRRSRAKIVLTMLKASSTGTTKTHLMHRTGLNYPNFTDYLKELVEEGLLEIVMSKQKPPLYRTTKEGRETMRLLKEAEKRIEL